MLLVGVNAYPTVKVPTLPLVLWIGVPSIDCDTVEPTKPLKLTDPLNAVTGFPKASLAASVAPKGEVAICGEGTAPQVNAATAPACTANELLLVDRPPLLADRTTAGSATVSRTLPLHTPAANVSD